MFLNVWGIIWPNQKKILGIVPATDEEKAKARKTALYASRTNFILSIPMLLCMAATSHGLPVLIERVDRAGLTTIIARQVAAALAEDLGGGDVTAALVPASAAGARAGHCARTCDSLRHRLGQRNLPATRSRRSRSNGRRPTASASSPIRPCSGWPAPARPILTGERTALNFLQTLSGDRHRRASLRRSRGRHRLPDPRHAQDDSGSAAGAEIRGALRRRAEPSPRPATTWCSSRKTTSSPPARSQTAIATARRTSPGVPVEVEVESLGGIRPGAGRRRRHHHAR